MKSVGRRSAKKHIWLALGAKYSLVKTSVEGVLSVVQHNTSELQIVLPCIPDYTILCAHDGRINFGYVPCAKAALALLILFASVPMLSPLSSFRMLLLSPV
jgi:hypothetical protein